MRSVLLSIILFAAVTGCKHEIPVPVEGTQPTPVDPPPPPCDPDVIYFEQQVLPLVISSCAIPDCHDSYSGEPEFALNSYNDLVNNQEEENLVIPGSPGQSDLLDVIFDGEMPPDGYDPLTAEQIAILSDWIQQGAQNNSCEDLYCDTLDVTFSGTIMPLIENRCQGCHSGSSPQGSLSLNNYSQVQAIVNDQSLWGAVNHENGFVAMPYNSAQLPLCNLDQIRIWIEAGAPNN